MARARIDRGPRQGEEWFQKAEQGVGAVQGDDVAAVLDGVANEMVGHRP